MSAGGNSQAKISWPSILQFICSGLALAIIWGLAFLSLLNNFLFPKLQFADSSGQNWFAFAGIFALGCLLIPSTILALRRLLGHPSREIKIPGGVFGFSILLVPVILIVGNWQSGLLGGWVVILHILAALLSVGWLLWLAIQNLNPGSGQRAWGTLGSGLALTPVLALIFEIIVGIFLVVLFAIYVQTNPELMQAVDRLSNLANQTKPNEEVILNYLAPFLKDPVVLALTLVGLSLFIPLIEEVFKPVAVMLLLGRDLTNAQGFALGAISGAGYALAENLMLGVDMGSWAAAAVGRFGTSAMHIFTTALSGYALVRAKNEKRYLGLLGIYLLNVVIHGTWNGLAVATYAGVLSHVGTGGFPPPQVLLAPSLLAGLAIVCIFSLRRYNRRLAESQTQESSSAWI